MQGLRVPGFQGSELPVKDSAFKAHHLCFKHQYIGFRNQDKGLRVLIMIDKKNSPL